MSPGSSRASRSTRRSRCSRRAALYTEEINAAIRGAKAGGRPRSSSWTVTAPARATFNSLIPEDLDPDCEFVVQDEWTGYTDFLEQGCDAASSSACTRAPAPADGVLNHTVSGVDWQNLWFNGTLVGETGINAALCGHLGLPRPARHGRPGGAREAASCSEPA